MPWPTLGDLGGNPGGRTLGNLGDDFNSRWGQPSTGLPVIPPGGLGGVPTGVPFGGPIPPQYGGLPAGSGFPGSIPEQYSGAPAGGAPGGGLPPAPGSIPPMPPEPPPPSGGIPFPTAGGLPAPVSTTPDTAPGARTPERSFAERAGGFLADLGAGLRPRQVQRANPFAFSPMRASMGTLGGGQRGVRGWPRPTGTAT